MRRTRGAGLGDSLPRPTGADLHQDADGVARLRVATGGRMASASRSSLVSRGDRIVVSPPLLSDGARITAMAEPATSATSGGER
jgi:hypothetical protein